MPSQAERYAQLDGLRGLAASAVLFFHYFGIFPAVFESENKPISCASFGAYGVQLFFIVSGFVIFMTLARATSARDFVATRIIRLYPSYWVTILLTSCIIATGVFPDTGVTRHSVSLGQIAINFTMLEAFFNVPTLDGTYWTLAHELSFYGWTLLMLVAFDRERIERYAAGFLLLNGVLAFALGHDAIHVGSRLRTLLLVDYGHFFIIGIAFYRMRTLGPSALRHGLIACAFASEAMRGNHESTLALLLFIAVFYALHAGKLQWLSARPLVWLGSISYALYLTHEMPGWALAHVLRELAVPYWTALLITLVAAVTTAWVITRFIEAPTMGRLKVILRRAPS